MPAPHQGKKVLQFLVNVNKDQNTRSAFLANPSATLMKYGITISPPDCLQEIENYIKKVQNQSTVIGHASIIPDGDPLDSWLKVIMGNTPVTPVDPQVLIT